jgi:hypothetical protein
MKTKQELELKKESLFSRLSELKEKLPEGQTTSEYIEEIKRKVYFINYRLK